MPNAITVFVLFWLGASIGSFLNVIIYRLPSGLSIITPPSFCPQCRNPIKWYDNIPILSYILLLGRCRYCSSVISPRYATVELTSALLFVSLYDAAYIGNTHSWFSSPYGDISLFVSHLVLLSVLLATSVMDIEYYFIDIRLVMPLYLAGPAGFMLLSEGKIDKICNLPVKGAALVSSLFVGTIAVLLYILRPRNDNEKENTNDDGKENPAKTSGENLLIYYLLLLLYIAVGISLVISAALDCFITSYTRSELYIVIIFIATLVSLLPQRESDKEIEDFIESTTESARKTALKEIRVLVLLSIAFAIGFAVPYLIKPLDGILTKIAAAPRIKAITFSLYSLYISALFGWSVRIVFSLLFGKEAMGIGDIYILAGIGAIAGYMVAIVGFFIGSIIGLLGILLLIVWKRYRAVSYIPWIAIGTFICLLFYRPIINYILPLQRILILSE